MADKVLHDVGVEVIHHESGGVYMKECRVPADTHLEQHVHEFDHLSILAKGVAIVTIDKIAHLLHAPYTLVIEAGKEHAVRALTPIVWFCIWPTGIVEQVHAKLQENCGEK